MTKWREKPALNHGDIRTKNILIDDKGKISAIFDWENCISTIVPYWDLSISLHDLNLDEKQEFLAGYGIKEMEFSRIAKAVKAFNLINYAPVIQRIAARKQTRLIEHYRLRFNGLPDLYSL
ncbi:MAG: phosphotransferase [Chitinophagales bacterium]